MNQLSLGTNARSSKLPDVGECIQLLIVGATVFGTAALAVVRFELFWRYRL